MHHTFKMSYLEPILVHPVRREIFCDTSAQIFFTILKLRLIHFKAESRHHSSALR